MPADPHVLTFEGPLGIEQADAFKAKISQVISKTKSISLDLSKVDSMDLTAVQIIIAAKKSAIKKGIEFSVQSQMSPALIRALWLSGILNRSDSKEINFAIDEHLRTQL